MRKCDSFMGRLFLLCVSNIGLQLLGFVYRIFLSRFAGAEGLGVYRLAFSAYIVIHAATLSGVTMACTRLSAEWSAQGRAGAVRQLVYRAARTFLCFFLCAGTILLGFRDWIGTELLGDGRTVDAMPIMLVCILLTGVENILKSTMIGMNRVDNAAASELTEQIVRIGATIALLSFEQTADLGRIAVLIFTGMAISECVSAAMMVHMYRGLRLPAHCPPPIGKDPFWKIVLPVSASALVTNGIASAVQSSCRPVWSLPGCPAQKPDFGTGYCLGHRVTHHVFTYCAVGILVHGSHASGQSIRVQAQSKQIAAFHLAELVRDRHRGHSSNRAAVATCTGHRPTVFLSSCSHRVFLAHRSVSNLLLLPDDYRLSAQRHRTTAVYGHECIVR